MSPDLQSQKLDSNNYELFLKNVIPEHNVIVSYFFILSNTSSFIFSFTTNTTEIFDIQLRHHIKMHILQHRIQKNILANDSDLTEEEQEYFECIYNSAIYSQNATIEILNLINNTDLKNYMRQEA